MTIEVGAIWSEPVICWTMIIWASTCTEYRWFIDFIDLNLAHLERPFLKGLCLCSNCCSLIWSEVAGTILAFGRQMSGGCNTVLFLKIIHHAFRQLRGRLWDIPKKSGMSAFFGWLCQCESVDSWCKGVFQETRLPPSTYHLVWQRGPFSHLLSSQGCGSFFETPRFVCFDGLPKESMAIRKFDDQKLAMEVAGQLTRWVGSATLLGMWQILFV